MRLLSYVIFAGFISSPLFAAPLTGFSFADKDWEVSCDNTGTCRAAGYSINAVSVLLTRAAGSDANIKIEVAFAQRIQGQPPLTTATLFINGQNKDKLINFSDGYFTLDYEQRGVFLIALRQNDTIEFESEGKRIPLSTAGSSTVLQKMDVFQKRINTSSALLHPGNKNNDNVLPAEPAPLIITHPVISTPDIEPLTTAQRKKIEQQLKIMPDMECRELSDGEERVYYRIPVDKQYVLIQTECFDSFRFAIWLTDTGLTDSPVLITNDANEYENGEIVRFGGPIQRWQWTGKQFVLTDEYRSGGQESISINGVWTLPTFVSTVRTQFDVDSDNAALKTLYTAILELKKNNAQQDLIEIAKQFPLTGKLTDFTITYNEDSPLEDSPLPATKPSPEISDDEWLALSLSSIRAYSEHGQVNYTLVDLDGDGKRDLIIDSYIGGTGLFSYSGVMKRGDDNFFVINKSMDDNDTDVPGALFSENGRGANQWSQWVRINGQSYALWFNGRYGEDKLYLLRPFSSSDKVPVVTIRYRYEYDNHSIQSEEEGQPLKPELNSQDRAKLIDALNMMQNNLSNEQQYDQQPLPICPIPADTLPEDVDNYSVGIAGHYVTQPIAVIPVWLNGKCFIGSVESYFGRGEYITISSPRDRKILGLYYLAGLRHVTSLKIGWASKKADNIGR